MLDKVNVNGIEIDVIGDPHLGRRFLTNVPLDRRGDREDMVWQDFEDAVTGGDCWVNICMGDLFDKSVVSYADIYRAFVTYSLRCAKAKHIRYYVIAGNHDLSKDANSYSALDILGTMMKPYDNFRIIQKPEVVEIGEDTSILLVPYDPFQRSGASLQYYDTEGHSIRAIFGHWDIDLRLKDTDNFIPLDVLSRYPTADIYNGHFHLPGEHNILGRKVTCVGSLQPFGFDQDPKGEWYQALTLAEFNERLKTCGPRYFRNINLKLTLREHDDIPIIDCLSLHIIRENQVEAVDLTVEFDSFDFEKLFAATMAANNVPPQLQVTLRNQYLELRNAEVGKQ